MWIWCLEMRVGVRVARLGAARGGGFLAKTLAGAMVMD